MKVETTEQHEFIELIRNAGLDPSLYDIPEMHEAWLALSAHMQRLRSEDRHPTQQGLSVSDPTWLTQLIQPVSNRDE